MAERLPCEQCPIYQNFLHEDRAKVAAAVQEFVPNADEAVVQRYLQSEEQIRQKILAGAAECPGYRPLSGFLKFAVKLFDGQPGLGFEESTHCANATYHDPAFKKETETTRAEFERLLAE